MLEKGGEWARGKPCSVGNWGPLDVREISLLTVSEEIGFTLRGVSDFTLHILPTHVFTLSLTMCFNAKD